MAVQKVLPVQNPTLRSKAKPVQSFDKRIQKLIKDLEDTLVAQKDPEGVGLAAPQLGLQAKVFIIRLGKSVISFINPEIVWRSKETNDPKSDVGSQKSEVGQKSKTKNLKSDYIMEGCLSLPHYYGPVMRAKKIKVRYQRPKIENGEWKLENTEQTLTGLPAQIVQHEVDHLNGILFIDHLLRQKRKLYHWTGKDWEEVGLT